MAEQQTIHPERLTPKGVVFEGVLRPGDLAGLEEELAGPEGELRYRVTARLDENQRRAVSCIINGFVFLTAGGGGCGGELPAGGGVAARARCERR